MLLLVSRRGRMKSLESFRDTPIPATCLLRRGRYCSCTGDVIATLPTAHPTLPGVALRSRATSSHLGGGTKYHTKQTPPPHATARSRTRHTTAFTCNKSVPTGHTAPESFSTVTRSCHVSGGLPVVAAVVWLCTRAGPRPHRGHLTLRQTPGSPALYLQERYKHITLHKRL